MNAKTRLILATVMTSMMVLMVTFVATYLNLGFRADFGWQWFRAWAISWPVAAITGFLVMPFAQRVTGRIMAAIDRS